jgi:AcrR family transcriptional regulator
MAHATAERPRAADRIQHAAKELFYRQGIRATGVEEVCRVAEATKMSLYRAYPSKDALVAAILEEDAAAWDQWFEGVTGAVPDAAGKLRALVESIAAKVENPAYRGCPMLLAQAEFPDPDHPTHRLVACKKQRMRDTMVELVREAGIEDPDMVADTLAMLFDGAWATLPYLGGQRAAEILRHAAACALRDVPG